MNAVVTPILQPDATAMQAHIEHLFGGFLDGCQDGLVELAWTDTRPDESGRHRLRNARLYGTDQLDELVEEAARLNATPMCNVYIGAALRHPHTAPFGRAKDDDAWALTALYVDLDDPGVALAAKEIYRDAKPTMVVVTGRAPHTRAQLWWRLSEVITDTGEWPAALRGIAAAMNGDPTVTNPSRVMRLAGSIAWPVKEGRTIEATGIQPLRNPGQQAYAADHIKRLFPPVAAPAGGEASVTGVEAQHSTNSLGLSSKIKDGRERYMRDTVLACLIEFIGENGTEPSAQDLFDAAWPQYEQHVDLETRGGRGPDEFAEKCRYTLERFARGELRGLENADAVLQVWSRKKQANQGWSRAQPAQEAQPEEVQTTVPLSSAFPINALDIPPRSWVVPGLLIRRHTSLLVAPGGVGKSLLTLQTAMALGSGKPWAGWSIDRPYRTLVINAEDDTDELRRRMVAATSEMDLRQEDIGDRVLLADDPESIVVAKIDPKTKAVIRMPLVEQLVASIVQHQIDVIIVDPFAETFEGEENSNSEMKWVAAIWREIGRRTNAAVLLVHHTKKYAKDMGGDADAARGGGALVNSARIAATLFAMTDDEASKFEIPAEDRTRYVRFDDAKANLSLITSKSKWFKKVSVDIGNAQGLRPSDEVGVLVPWSPPGPFDGISIVTLNHALDEISRGVVDEEGKPTGVLFSPFAQSKTRWVGQVVKNFVGCDDARAKAILAAWFKSGQLKEVEHTDNNRNRTKGVIVDDTRLGVIDA
ncbi:AAA family ATPase [Kaistia sp. MMO-174]|uniref:AAA family ATPase n=1 Tax=Kaistia sp. MMO-174 TaxID=3081256 RepID=UPI003016DD35